MKGYRLRTSVYSFVAIFVAFIVFCDFQPFCQSEEVYIDENGKEILGFSKGEIQDVLAGGSKKIKRGIEGAIVDEEEDDAILNEMKNGRPAKLLSSQEDIDDFIASQSRVATVIGFFDDAQNQLDMATFETVAKRNGAYLFGYTTNKDLIAKKKYKGCVVYTNLAKKYYDPNFDKAAKSRYPLSKLSSAEALEEWIHSKSLPLVGEIAPQNLGVYLKRHLPILTFFTTVDHNKNPAGYAYSVKRATQVATKFRGAILVGISDKSALSADNTYGFTDEEMKKKDVLVGIRFKPTEKYPNPNSQASSAPRTNYYKMDEDVAFSVDNVIAFVESFKSGQLLGIYKSR